MNVARYRAGDRRYLAVDAERYVPDRAAFAARHCDDDEGVAPPADAPTPVHGQQGVSPPGEGADVATPDGGDPEGGPVVTGADGVLFLALEPDFTPPRVVMTVVHPDGERTPCCTEGVRCAARWVARRTGAARVMVDTQAGTRAARVHEDGSVSVEVDAGAAPEHGPVTREFAVEVSEPTP